MSNEQLLLTVVQDSIQAAELAQSLVHRTEIAGCVLKPEAVPALVLCRQKLSSAHNAALELERRAKNGDPRGAANLLVAAGSELGARMGENGKAIDDGGPHAK